MDGGEWTCVTTRDGRAELEATIASLTRRIDRLEAARAADVAASAPVRTAPARERSIAAPAAAAAASPGTPDRPDAFEQVAEVVPPAEVGRTPGEPMVIAPAPAAEQGSGPEPRGIVDRVAGWLPEFGW